MTTSYQVIMSRVARLTFISLLLVTTIGWAVQSQADASSLTRSTPESVGMSSERLERLSAGMQALVDEGRLAGITTMITRHGKIVHFETFGHQDMAAGTAMAEDSIFRIYSMSKPITGVALMMLYEEGLFRLSDPVEKYIPSFEGLTVATGEDENGITTEPADHPMTIRELMSHTSGLSYGIFSQSPVDTKYREADMTAPGSTLQDMIDKLSGIPLRQQPGTIWHYSLSVDVQGYLVEVLSGQRFDEFLRERIFAPLGMVDSGFYVPATSVYRFASVYTYDEDGKLTAPPQNQARGGYLDPPTFLSGGGGMVSTSTDYMRFCQMLLNGGELDGVRLLAPITVELMHRNQLPTDFPEMRPGAGTGFGLDFAVVIDPVAADTISEGEYYWGGAAGTWFWIDPREDLAFVGMIQQFGQGRPDVRSLSRRLTYQAILKPRR